jgi:predicted DNA-binding protein
MSKTVTLRLKEDVYERLKRLAKDDNRPLSNYIETAALRFADDDEFADEFEMKEIRENTGLNRSLKKGRLDAKAKRGQFV